MLKKLYCSSLPVVEESVVAAESSVVAAESSVVADSVVAVSSAIKMEKYNRFEKD